MKRDAIRLLQEQHLVFRVLLANLDALSADSAVMRRDLLATVSGEVALHTVIEDEIVLPSLRGPLELAGQRRIYRELVERHDFVDFDFVVTPLQRLDPASAEFGTAARELRHLVDAHTRMEDALLSVAREFCDDALLHALAVRMEDLLVSITGDVDRASSWSAAPRSSLRMVVQRLSA
jgi:hypothetical protein